MGFDHRFFVEQRQKARHSRTESFFFLKPIPIDRELRRIFLGQPADNCVAEVAGHAGAGDAGNFYVVERRKICVRRAKLRNSLPERLQDRFDLFQHLGAGRVCTEKQDGLVEADQLVGIVKFAVAKRAHFLFERARHGAEAAL